MTAAWPASEISRKVLVYMGASPTTWYAFISVSFLPFVGVHHDGAGALVHQGHLHRSPELPVLDLLQALLAHFGQEQLVGLHREGRLCGPDEAGAHPLFGVAVEG